MDLMCQAHIKIHDIDYYMLKRQNHSDYETYIEIFIPFCSAD